MATSHFGHNLMEIATTHFQNNNTEISETLKSPTYPLWYSPETGIYSSKHPPVDLPSDPFLDVVSLIFSRQHHGDSALIDSSSGSSISYPKFYSFVKSIASGLQNMGVSQGDVVLILLPNSVYFPIVFLGVLYLGAVVTTMNPLSSVIEIKKQITDCNARFAFSLPDKIEKLKELGFPAIGVPEYVSSDSKETRFLHFYDLIHGSLDLSSRPVIKQQDVAAIMYSSGTTGVSKGVVLTHRNLIATVELFVRFEASQYEYSSLENVYLAVLPMFHIYGLSIFVLGLLSLGSSVVVMRRFNANEAMKAIDRFGVTHVPAVPPVLTALTKTAKGGCRNDLKSLKQVSCGAAPLSRKVIDDFVQTFPHVDFIQGYGLTESTAVGTRGFNTANIHNYTSIGLLAPNMEAKVVDFNTSCCLPPGSSGELWIRGPAIMEGYLKNPEATTMTVDKDGWLHTGDIVYIDMDGYFHLHDRLKEIIKYKGFQIAPADLEAVLISHPEILDAAVTGATDEKYGQIPVAFVVRRHGSSITEAAVLDYVAQQVAPYKRLKKVVFTHSIPRSAAGKILRRELLKSLMISRL